MKKLLFYLGFVSSLVSHFPLTADTITVDESALVMDRKGEEDKISHKAHDLLANQSYDLIEQTEKEMVTGNRRSASGIALVQFFYNGLCQIENDDDALWRQQTQHLRDWGHAKPDSILAAAALADGLVEYGASQEDTSSPSSGFKGKLSEARKILEKAYADHPGAEIPPLWYHAILLVALYQAWSHADYDRWYNEAVAKYPDYYGFTFAKAVYLKPNWCGKEGEWQAFAEQCAKDHGPEYYTRICWSLFQISANDKFLVEQHVKWDLMKTGFEKILKDWPTSRWNLNYFCFFACLAEDKETAKSLFPAIGRQWYRFIWDSPEKFRTCRNWAMEDEAPEN